MNPGDPATNWRRSNLGNLLFRAGDRCVRDKLRVLHAAGFGGVTDAQLALFHQLDLGEARLTDLAARAGLTKQSMIELVDKAEKLGFVTREPDPDDKRAKIVAFTRAGRHLLATLHAAVEEAEQRVADVTGAPFLETMKLVLGRYSALSPAPGAPFGADEAGAAWRGENVGRVFALSARRFVQDVLGVVRAGGRQTIGEWLFAVFRNLDLDGTRLTELAARARITKQSMRELVDRAEALDLVRRVPDQADKRAKTIVFTDEGLALLDEMRLGISEAEARFGAAAGAAFLAELKERLRDYADAV